METTYLLHLRVVLVLMMVRSRPHHLRHQWSQISTFVSLNHNHHHTSFKNSYVHVQVFHILHHHTMKFLQAFESFLPGRPIIEIGSENQFAVGCTIWQRKLFRCWHTISVANVNSLHITQFRQQVTYSLQTTQPQQRVTISLKNTKFGSEFQIRCI